MQCWLRSLTLSLQVSRGAAMCLRGWGEFVALVNGLDREDVERIAMRVQSKFARTAVSTPRGEVFGACSFGIAEYDEQDGHLEALVARADAALHRAKLKTGLGR
jgi:GGDEF domain-containing protein